MKKSTMIIIGLVVVLTAVYFLTRQEKVSVGIKHLELPSFEQSSVDRIEISGKNSATLMKEGDHWVVEIGEADKKQKVSADVNYIESMLNAVKDMKPSYYVTELSDKLKDLGLDDASSSKVVLKAKDATVWSLVLGNNASGGGRYAKLPESKDVYVVKASFWQVVRNGAVDWRNRVIVAVKEEDVVSVKLTTLTHSLTLVKKEGTNDWQLAPEQSGLPQSFRANQSALLSLVRSAVSLRATGFIDEERALSEPIATVFITDKDKKEHSYKVYPDTADKVVVVGDGSKQLFEVAKNMFDRVDKKLEDLRDLSVMKFDTALITKISLAEKNGHIIVEKKENTWSIVEPKTLPKGFEFDDNAPNDVLSVLNSIKGVRVVDPKKDVALNAHWLSTPLVELFDKEGNTIKLFASKSKTKDEYLLKGNIDETLYVMSESKLTMLISGLESFKKVALDMPHVDEHTQGFQNLPVDVQRKLLEAVEKNKNK